MAKKENKEVKELTDDLKRVQAEFINYKSRTEKELANSISLGKELMVEKLLTIIDNFELALNNTKDKGIEMIYAQLIDILEKEGLKEIECKTFDPNIHEALLSEESDKPENTILEVLQKGYMFNDKVIRVAKVKVAK